MVVELAEVVLGTAVVVATVLVETPVEVVDAAVVVAVVGSSVEVELVIPKNFNPVVQGVSHK